MAVRPSISCGKCGSPLNLNDKFCAKCGTAVMWNEENLSQEEKSSLPSKIVCPSCGILDESSRRPNSSTNSVCSGCGTSLVGVASLPPAKTSSGSLRSTTRLVEEKKKISGATQQQARKVDDSTRRASSSKRLETWKILSIGGAVVVLVLLGIGVFRNPPKEVNPQNQTLNVSADGGVSPTLLTDIEAFQKSVDANPKDTEALLRLANALHDAKFMPRAIETYKKYLQLKPADPDARVDMAICYFESGDSQTALKEMQTALTYDPKHQMAMFNIGIVNLNQGNIEQSNAWFKKAAAVNPNTQIAQRAQQILTQHSTIQQ